MVKQYATFIGFLTVLLLAEAILIRAYIPKQPLPLTELVGFISAFIAILGSIEYIRREAKKSVAHEKDEKLLEEFLTILSPGGDTIYVLKNHDFHGKIKISSLDGIREFRYNWQNVDKEFFDSKIEIEKKSLYSMADEFMSKYAQYTSPVDNGEYASVFNDSMYCRENYDEIEIKCIEQAKELNKLAHSFSESYEIFVRNTRKRLIV